MLVLGLHGSPRRKGNTRFLLDCFLEEAARLGARTHMVDVPRSDIVPCKELVVCEKKGFCPIDDIMQHEIYGLLREAEVVVAASPVFFYNVTAQLKALIDRCQALWARKYRLKLADPCHHTRRGVLLSAGATAGKNLFEGLKLTEFAGSLTYRKIEGPRDMEGHPTARDDVRVLVEQVVGTLSERKKILFACRENACRSQMAGAFAQFIAGDRLDVATGGSAPTEAVNPVMVEAMREKGIDMAFRRPTALAAAIDRHPPDVIVTMGCGEACPVVPGARVVDWDLPDPAGGAPELMRRVRDDIEDSVRRLIAEIV
jgi:arsenate reductase